MSGYSPQSWTGSTSSSLQRSMSSKEIYAAKRPRSENFIKIFREFFLLAYTSISRSLVRTNPRYTQGLRTSPPSVTVPYTNGACIKNVDHAGREPQRIHGSNWEQGGVREWGWHKAAGSDLKWIHFWRRCSIACRSQRLLWAFRRPVKEGRYVNDPSLLLFCENNPICIMTVRPWLLGCLNSRMTAAAFAGGLMSDYDLAMFSSRFSLAFPDIHFVDIFSCDSFQDYNILYWRISTWVVWRAEARKSWRNYSAMNFLRGLKFQASGLRVKKLLLDGC